MSFPVEFTSIINQCSYLEVGAPVAGSQLFLFVTFMVVLLFGLVGLAFVVVSLVGLYCGAFEVLCLDGFSGDGFESVIVVATFEGLILEGELIFGSGVEVDIGGFVDDFVLFAGFLGHIHLG